jgi:hypothetical protein
VVDNAHASEPGTGAELYVPFRIELASPRGNRRVLDLNPRQRHEVPPLLRL